MVTKVKRQIQYNDQYLVRLQKINYSTQTESTITFLSLKKNRKYKRIHIFNNTFKNIHYHYQNHTSKKTQIDCLEIEFPIPSQSPLTNCAKFHRIHPEIEYHTQVTDSIEYRQCTESSRPHHPHPHMKMGMKRSVSGRRRAQTCAHPRCRIYPYINSRKTKPPLKNGGDHGVGRVAVLIFHDVLIFYYTFRKLHPLPSGRVSL